MGAMGFSDYQRLDVRCCGVPEVSQATSMAAYTLAGCSWVNTYVRTSVLARLTPVSLARITLLYGKVWYGQTVWTVCLLHGSFALWLEGRCRQALSAFCPPQDSVQAH